MGDNGKPNDNMLMHVLSPYPAHRSAVTDCYKLARSTLGKRKAVMIVAYEYEDWPAEPAIDAFEALAGRQTRLGTRFVAAFDDLVHPVHRSGAVFVWEIEPA
jgi:hypothetical protein